MLVPAVVGVDVAYGGVVEGLQLDIVDDQVPSAAAGSNRARARQPILSSAAELISPRAQQLLIAAAVELIARRARQLDASQPRLGVRMKREWKNREDREDRKSDSQANKNGKHC